jgi:Fe-S-cluster-containing hydrogenase component 2/bacterioferritin-associated ferredoxin
VVSAEGDGKLERITTAAIDEGFKPIEGTARTWEVDTLLIAVGLSPIDELYYKITEFGLDCWTCGDSAEIAEASAAIFSGKITGRKIAQSLGHDVEIPDDWDAKQEVLRSKPGAVVDFEPETVEGKPFPVIRCVEEIPCNPCVDSCSQCSIVIEGDPIMGLPEFRGECSGCLKCVAACPALAITLVRPDTGEGTSQVVVPYELDASGLEKGTEVRTVDFDGKTVGTGKIVRVTKAPGDDKRKLVAIEVPSGQAVDVSAILELEVEEGKWGGGIADSISDDTIVCRCERVTAGEIRAEIRAGVRDMNILKATVRSGMGACGGKTCTELILRLYREEGIDYDDVTLPTERPFVAEVPLSAFAGIKESEGK